MIRKLIAWLNKRFPEQMVVTMGEYQDLREEMGQLNLRAQAIDDLNKRVQTLEREVTILNAAQGFVSPTGHGSGRLER
jgi:hypothetical protein